MTPGVIASLIVAGIAVLGAIGSVALLAFRVGILTGTVTARIDAGDQDRARIWESIGKLTGSLQRHLEVNHGGARGVR